MASIVNNTVSVRVNAYETEGLAKVGNELVSFIIKTDKPIKTDAAFSKAARKANPDFKYVMRAGESKRIARWFNVPFEIIEPWEVAPSDANDDSTDSEES